MQLQNSGYSWLQVLQEESKENCVFVPLQFKFVTHYMLEWSIVWYVLLSKKHVYKTVCDRHDAV